MHRGLVPLVVLASSLACAGLGETSPPEPAPPATDAAAAPAPGGKHKARGHKAPAASTVPAVASSTGTPGAGTLVSEIYDLYKPDAHPPGFGELGVFSKS